MKELIETIARALVDKPELVIVKESETEEGILLELSVDETDIGKVIGKSGKIAKAIRNVVKAAAKGNDKKVVFEIR